MEWRCLSTATAIPNHLPTHQNPCILIDHITCRRKVLARDKLIKQAVFTYWFCHNRRQLCATTCSWPLSPANSSSTFILLSMSTVPWCLPSFFACVDLHTSRSGSQMLSLSLKYRSTTSVGAMRSGFIIESSFICSINFLSLVLTLYQGVKISLHLLQRANFLLNHQRALDALNHLVLVMSTVGMRAGLCTH